MKKFCLYLIMISIVLFVSCNRPRIVVEHNNEGFDVVKVYRGDTICPIIWQGKNAVVDSTGELREGRFFKYHKNESIVTRFICCDKTYGGEIINGHIDDYISDSTFLLTDQKPVDSILGGFIKVYYDKDDLSKYYSRREYDTCQNYHDKMIMLHLNRIHQYWIINKTDLDVYGPLTFEQYLDMKKQLDVPTTLMLKREKYSK